MHAPPETHYEALTVAELARLHDRDARLRDIEHTVHNWRGALRFGVVDTANAMADICDVIER